MSKKSDLNNSCTEEFLGANVSGNESLQDVINARYSRRNLLRSGFSATAVAMFGGLPLAACGGDGNDAPTVSAGASASTNAGRAVSLAGTATDDSTVSSVAWTQTSGPSVTLTNANTNTASFVAPSVSNSTPLGFRFTATDADGKTSSADTTVTVQPSTLGFTAVPKNLNDIVTVPDGYTVTVLYRLGDPITAATPAYKNDGTDTGFSTRSGDQHDGMALFGLAASGNARDDNSNTRGLLAINHENIMEGLLHPGAPSAAPRPEGEALKEMEAHGVSVVEVTRGASGWGYVQNSGLNRRITPLTQMVFKGPAAGSALLQTAFSPTGAQGRGTINNCAAGPSGWGTYLTCEENWAGYFRRPSSDNAARPAKEVTALNRYGVTSSTGANQWATVTPADGSSTIYARWDATVKGASATADFRNEPNQLGWVVEIDPYDPASTPRKRTALGRMGHENAKLSLLKQGVKFAVYMGDDNRDDYFYKFVSNTAWNPADANASDRLAVGDKYLDAGVLYVAKINADGTGQWLPLVFGQNGLTAANTTYPFADQADVLVNTRLAADTVGATKMDRPEWVAVNPVNGEVYLTLTNTNASARPINETDAANPRFYNDPKGSANTAQTGNPNGHIIRLREDGDTSEATSFKWDIYAFGAGADLDKANINLSELDASNDFSSPDGLWFGKSTNPSGQVNPLLWIQTDDGAYTDVTNNQMLVAMPGAVGDGSSKIITNTSGATTAQQATRVGKLPGASLRRFLVGPKGCEITGIDSTPDGRTLFVNIQHPGEGVTSNWPASQTNAAAVARPRSATVVITKNDGGVVGL